MSKSDKKNAGSPIHKGWFTSYNKNSIIKNHKNANNFANKPTIFLSIGRIEWIKGFDKFMRMIPKLVEEGVDVRYFIAGKDNGYKETLDILAKELGISNRVYYMGYISGDDKLSMLQNADYLICSSVTESFGLTVLEAQASNLIPIINNIGALKELVKDGENGIIVDFDDINEYSKILKISIKNIDWNKKKIEYNRCNLAKQYLYL